LASIFASMIDFELLKRISETPGAPGFETQIRNLVKKEIEGLVDEVYIDSMGSLIGIRKGREPKRAMVAAHMDEISFIVTHIDDEGFIRFHPLGGFDPKTLTAQRVIVHGREDVIGVMGSKPVHLMTPEEKNKMPQIRDYFIDTGYPAESVKNLVAIGDPITRERQLIRMGHCINGKSLDNRLSVYILIETLKALQGKALPYDFYAAFTVQEEVGLRGAFNAAGHVDPDFGIGLDVTIAYDTPGALPYEMVTQLGKGTAIKILDGSIICDGRMIAFMKAAATRHAIPYQLEILPAGGTDTGALQRQGAKGSIAGAISIPLRHVHQSIEMAHEGDIIASVDLLAATISELDQWNWEL
ncbi:MAG TPA: M42 family metallopeptidase, partial [Saprospiraceae bacterium]|nr:M42 family metallopeptidase [Saprospiraceae bacterium]